MRLRSHYLVSLAFGAAVCVRAWCAAPAVAAEDDWPTYLHDATRSGYSRQTVVPPTVVEWEFPLDRVRRLTPPVISGGRVFFGATNHSLYALDALSGRPLWSFRSGDDIRSVPAIAQGLVFFGSNDRKVYALDAATGAKRWEFATRGAVTSSPCIVDGAVYFGSQDHKVYALDADTGTLRWSVETGGNVVATPAVRGNTLFIGSRDHRFYALDRGDGSIQWTSKFGADLFAAASLHGDSLFVLDVLKGVVRLSQFGEPTPPPPTSPTLKLPPGDDEHVFVLGAARLERFSLAKSQSTGVATVPDASNVDPILCGDTFCFAQGNRIYGFSLNQRRFSWMAAAPRGEVTALAAAYGRLYFATNWPAVGMFAPFDPRQSARVSERRNRPPVAVLIAAPQEARKRMTVMLDASMCYDPDGDAISVAWDGDLGEVQSQRRGTIQTVYRTSGSRRIRIRVTDARGATSQADAVVKVINLPPVALTAGSGGATDYEPVVLDGRASVDPDGDRIANYLWYEIVGREAVVTRYFGAGGHTFSLTVWDERLNADRDQVRADVVLQILPNSPPAGGPGRQ